MKTGQGKIKQILLDGSMWIDCPTSLIPSPGQYLLAHKNASDVPLPVPLFSMDTSPNGFRSAPPMLKDWHPGDILNFRGAFGHGFQIPNSAKKIALIALDDSYAYLFGVMISAIKRNVEIVFVCDSKPNELPEIVEVQPLQALPDVLQWADYVAFDVQRTQINQLREMLQVQNQLSPKVEAQVLIRTSMPCGGIADCGVCALTLNHEWKMICKDGPVFRLEDIF